MSLYDTNAVVVASKTVTEENMFDDFRTIQLFAMSLISASEIVTSPIPDADRFDSRTIREEIPAGMRTRITPVAVLVPVEFDNGTVVDTYVYKYEESLEIIEIGI